MRIAYVSTYLPQRCGIATYVDYLTRAMNKVNPEVEIEIIAEKGAFPIRRAKLEVIPCWDRREDYVAPILANSKGADIVHVQHEYSIYGFDDRLPRTLENLISAKRVVTIHCVRPSQFCERGRVDEDFAKRVAELADEVIVHLESQKAILTRLGVPPKKIHVIPHGTELSDVDKLESRKRLGLPKDARIMLMFGFVKPHKCLHVAIEALSEIRKEVKNVYLFVAGGLAPTAPKKQREYVEHIQKQVKDLGLSDRVILPNKFYPNDDVPYLFGGCDLVLFPYYEEDRSASGSFHLAVGAGKPIIASRMPKFEELKNICDELLILPHNASGIAQTAIRLFGDPEFEHFVLKKTREYAIKTSWQATAKKYLELYKRVLAG